MSEHSGIISSQFDRVPQAPSASLLLVAEDSPVVLEILLDSLVVAGIPKERLLIAEDGAEALALWQLHRAHIGAVITDLNMPRLSGMELIKEISTENKNPPFMLLHTSEFDGNDYEAMIILMGQARELGAQGVPKGEWAMFKDEVMTGIGLKVPGSDYEHKINDPV